MLSRRLLAAALTAFLAGSAGSALAQCDTRFILRNSSGVTVNEFYFGPSTDSAWGQDRLGSNVLPNGAALQYDTARPGAHDFRVVWANGQSAELMRLNICTVTEIVATPQGLASR